MDERPYERLEFPEPPPGRPYVVANMVTTLDGKTVNEGTAKGLGSRTDRELMKTVRRQFEAVLIGASTLRADEELAYPPGLLRCVISASGDLPAGTRFFTDAPERAVAFLTPDAPEPGLPTGVTVARVAGPAEALRWLADRGVRTLLVEGGATLNGHLVRAGLLDELFLTLAPKFRGGDGPSILSAPPFDPATLPKLRLISIYEEDGELFLRYKVSTDPQP